MGWDKMRGGKRKENEKKLEVTKKKRNEIERKKPNNLKQKKYFMKKI